MSIHCTSYPFRTPGPEVRVSRHWITLGGDILWDFPGPFLSESRKRGGPVDNAYPGFANGWSVVGELLREYLDRPRERLLEPFSSDHWELTDILRAADRRLGKAALLRWSLSLDTEHPAHRVLAERWGSGACP